MLKRTWFVILITFIFIELASYLFFKDRFLTFETQIINLLIFSYFLINVFVNNKVKTEKGKFLSNSISRTVLYSLLLGVSTYAIFLPSEVTKDSPFGFKALMVILILFSIAAIVLTWRNYYKKFK
jgi:ABC-type multidrug transport system permease subunit